MDGQERPLNLIPITAVLAVLGIGGYLLYDRPFVSVRPDQPPSYSRTYPSTEDIDARLWEDPFPPAHAHPTSEICRPASASGEGGSTAPATFQLYEDSAHTLRNLAFEVRRRVGDTARFTEEATAAPSASPADRIALMPVMVPGEPYAEQSERRRRMRNAVLSGLATSGYVPERGELIGHIDSCWSAAGKLVVDGRGRAVRIPFEWFLRDPLAPAGNGDRAGSVLVLWLDETEFRNGMLERIDDLLSHLVGYCYFGKLGVDCLRQAQIRDRFLFRLVGPATSGTLASLLEGTGAEPGDAKRDETPPEPSTIDPAPTHGDDDRPTEARKDDKRQTDEGVRRLLERTARYLDDPAQLFGPDGESNRRPRVEEIVRPRVRSAIDDLRVAERRASAGALETWYSEAHDPIASSLLDAGPDVEDSNRAWYRSVAQAWTEEYLGEALDRITVGTDDRSSDPAGDPSDPGVEFAEELCHLAFAPSDSGLGLQALVEQMADSGEKPRDPRLVNLKLCPLPGGEGPRAMITAFETVLQGAWKAVESQELRPPEFWSAWSRDLIADLQHAARDSAPGLTERATTAALRDLSLSSAQVDARIEEWVGNSRGRLQGTIKPASETLGQLEVYSSRATAAPSVLLAGTPDAGDGSFATLAGTLETRGIRRFVSTTVSDDHLARTLVAELDDRGVDLCRGIPDDHVALVGEWDTFYSRALMTVLEAEIARCRRCRKQKRHGKPCTTSTADEIRSLQNGERETPPHVHRFHYLRGLDGSLPSNRRGPDSARDEHSGAAGPGTKNDPAGQWDLGMDTRKKLERAIGPRQFDYMRRLSNRLLDTERELRRSGEGIQAIGVVGSDVYDKLLVLQALRRRFPRAIFFTTDLDARLVHPGDYGWNRNLVIASGFGLELGKPIQQSIPPFRDSYQTGSFLAVRLALFPTGATGQVSDAEEPRLDEEKRDRRRPNDLQGIHRFLTEEPRNHLEEPSLFEVARSGHYKLSVPTIAKNDASLPPDLSPPGRVRGVATKTVLWVGLLLGLGTCLIAPVSPPIRRFVTLRRWRRGGGSMGRNYWLALAGTLILIVFGRFAYLDGTKGGGGEPFELWEGISIWPTETVRLLAMFVAVLFLVFGWDRLVENAREIAARFGLPAPAETPRVETVPDGRSDDPNPVRQAGLALASWLRMRRSISICGWRSEQGDEPGDPVQVGDLWREYLWRGQLHNRLTRCLPHAAVYIAFGVVVIRLLGAPHLPYRGDTAFVTDRIVLYASISAVMVLTFFVVDATRLCRRFIDLLSNTPTDWNGAAPTNLINGNSDLEAEDMGELLDAELIASRTEVVGKLILYPFIVLFILLIARNGFFDNWDWPLSLILIFGGAATYALLCAVILRHAAEKARLRIVRRLRLRAYRAAGGNGDQEAPGRTEQLRMLLEEIEGLRRGAFAPWSKHPIVKALLLPFGGIGAVVLLDLLATVGL